MAYEKGHAGAAVAASMNLAKLHGLVVKKSETKHAVMEISDEPMSEVDWIREYSDI